jgi:hypothetical protein
MYDPDYSFSIVLYGFIARRLVPSLVTYEGRVVHHSGGVSDMVGFDAVA